MLEEYQDEFLAGLQNMNRREYPTHPVTPTNSKRQPIKNEPVDPFQNDFSPVDEQPMNQTPTAARPYRAQHYQKPPHQSKPQPIYEERELARALAQAGPGMGFARMMLMGTLSLAIVAGSFYASFTLGKKLFVNTPTQNSISHKNEIASTPDELPFSIKPEPDVAVSDKEYAEANRIREQLNHYQKNNLHGKNLLSDQKPKKSTAVRYSQNPQKNTVKKTLLTQKVQAVHRVIVGSFSRLENAKIEAARLKEAGFVPVVYRNSDNFYRVQIGVFKDRSNAEIALRQAVSIGYPAFISAK